MEIPTLKHHLNIFQIAEHLGIKVDPRTKRALCPFHNDTNPSLQFSQEKQIATCFSSNCTAGTMDVIKLTEKKLQLSTHETLKYLTNFAGGNSNGKDSQSRVTENTTENLEIIFKKLQENLTKSEKAKQYCITRNLNTAILEIGYNSGTYAHLKNCIIFPLKDKQDHIVSLYGRSISNNKEQRHFYLENRNGLYPKYPKQDTEKLILTEAVIDTATLLQISEIKEQYEILTCYGTNGLTEEHKTAIKELKNLKEIIFGFDNDDAGNKATEKYSKELQELLPNKVLSKIILPCKDLNDVAVKEGLPVFKEILEKRIIIKKENHSENNFFISSEKKKMNEIHNGQELQQSEKESEKLPVVSGAELNTKNPHKLIYKTQTATYYIKGGLSKMMDSMKVSIDIENNQTKVKKRDRLDLYMDKATEKLSREAAEKIKLRADLIEIDLMRLTDLLDDYRDKMMQEEVPGDKPQDKTLQVPQYIAGACMEFLQNPELMKNLFNKISQVGLVGEEKSRMLVLCIASSNKMRSPLHGIIQGTSGEGKTYLMTTICEMMPPEYWKPLTTLTDKSLFNMKKYQIHRHLMTIEDRVGMSEEVRIYFRELISKGHLIREATVSEQDGNYGTKTQVLMGPIASLTCTTEAEIHQDDANRCFLISIDESQEQRKRIIEHRNKKSAGMIDSKQEEEVRKFIQNCIRLLKPYEVINPYATKISLPEDAKDLIRLHNLFIGLIEQITLIHQYQRKKDKQGRLITEIADVEYAVDVMFDAIVLKVDDLNEKLRKFFERLKQYVKNKGGEKYESYNFKLLEIRMELDMGKTTVHENIQELLEMEYVQKVSGNEYRGYVYKISYWDSIEVLRTRVKRNLQEQIDKLREPVNGECSGVFGKKGEH